MAATAENLAKPRQADKMRGRESPMPDLPTGTVTFLLTDIERSTHLWEQHPEAMPGALARHDALIAEVVQQHGGAVVKSRGEGDSFFAVFARAVDAVVAAGALQQVLHAESWPDGAALRVRAAGQTGAAVARGGGGPAGSRGATAARPGSGRTGVPARRPRGPDRAPATPVTRGVPHQPPGPAHELHRARTRIGRGQATPRAPPVGHLHRSWRNR